MEGYKGIGSPSANVTKWGWTVDYINLNDNLENVTDEDLKQEICWHLADSGIITNEISLEYATRSICFCTTKVSSLFRVIKGSVTCSG